MGTVLGRLLLHVHDGVRAIVSRLLLHVHDGVRAIVSKLLLHAIDAIDGARTIDQERLERLGWLEEGRQEELQMVDNASVGHVVRLDGRWQ
jgi:hypothetical protein